MYQFFKKIDPKQDKNCDFGAKMIKKLKGTMGGPDDFFGHFL